MLKREVVQYRCPSCGVINEYEKASLHESDKEMYCSCDNHISWHLDHNKEMDYMDRQGYK